MKRRLLERLEKAFIHLTIVFAVAVIVFAFYAMFMLAKIILLRLLV